MTPPPVDATPLVLGPGGFAAVVWGTVVLVLAVFAYLVYALARDAGFVGR